MKKSVLFTCFLFVFSLGLLNAQQKSCCSTATASFAMLGSESSFQSAHLSPEPFTYQSMKGMMVTFDTPDGKKGNAFMVASLKKTDNYLFVFHEWWGLNDYIKQEAEKLANDLDGVNVMAIDLYDGKLATNAEDAGKLMQSIESERANAIIQGATKYIRANAKIQTIGWCFGGGWSLQASMLVGDKAKGCVMYYGMPEKDESKLEAFDAPVLGHFASNDGWINKEVVGEFEKQMTSLEKDIEIHWYEADHAFANPSNPKYNKEAAAAARALSVKFIKENFNQ